MNGASPEETLTRRVHATAQSPASAAPSPEDETRRVEARVATPDQNAIATRHVGAARSGSTPNTRAAALGALEPGAVLLGDCVVVRTHHNHESARPGLFECQAPEGRVMVKVAATEFPPQRDLWSKLPELNHPNVLRVFRTEEHGGCFYEVQEFCAGGTLADYVPVEGSGRPAAPPSWVEQSLVPAFQAAISYLHGQGIVHRDIKPSNLYLREVEKRKMLVVGDFDISSVLQTGRTSRATERAAGTWVYSAPEAFPRFMDDKASQLGASVVRSSDYYSFGVVIVELLLGTTSLHQSQLPDLYEFYLQGGRVEIPAGLPPRLAELLSGLLCRNRHRRWGGEEVARWLRHQTTDEDRRRIEEDRGYQLGRRVAAFNAFDKARPTNLQQLCAAMAREPQIALDELMSGDVMLNWIGQLDARLARLIRHDREQWRAQPRLALLCARLRLEPSAPLAVGEQQAHSAEEWAKIAQVAAAKGEMKAEDICNATSLLELETWLRLKEPPESDTADAVARIADFHGIAASQNAAAPSADPAAPVPDARLVLEELGWALLPRKPFVIARGMAAQSPQQIAEMALGNEDDWGAAPPAIYVAAFKRWKEGFLEAYLRQRLTDASNATSPLLEQMQKARSDFADKPFVAFEIVLRLLEPQLPPVEIEFHPKAWREILEVRYGAQATRQIPFRARGRGMPFAALQLQSQSAGLSLEEHEISHRKGHVTTRLRSAGDVRVGRPFRGTISLAGNATRLAGDAPSLVCKVTYPAQNTARKVAAGALAGALIFGGVRAALMPAAPIALSPPDASLIAGRTWIFLFAGLLLAFFGAARLWIWALGKHAR